MFRDEYSVGVWSIHTPMSDNNHNCCCVVVVQCLSCLSTRSVPIGTDVFHVFRPSCFRLAKQCLPANSLSAIRK